MNHLKELIREVPDYPKPGILFYDLTTLLKNPTAFHSLVDELCEHYEGKTWTSSWASKRADLFWRRRWPTA